jgi:DnaJ-class molecular chaperone
MLQSPVAERRERDVDYEVVLVCKECRGTGNREMQTGRYWADYVVEACPFCKGTGAEARYPIAREVPPAA